MRPLLSPNSSDAVDARQFVPHWAAIYRPYSNLLAVPTQSAHTTMRSTKSHLCLNETAASMENLTIDRTANSTPAAKYKFDMSHGRNAMLTPPTDTNIGSADLNKTTKQYLGHGNGGTIYLESQAEDDVFSGDTISKPDIDCGAPIVPASPILPVAPFMRTTRVAPAAQIPEVARTTQVVHDPQNAGKGVIEYAADNTIAPRSDRLLDPITSINAQGVLPPGALVFVANLSVNRSDDQLEESCRESFEKFGQCIVKVRRDKHKHPFALIQYHTIQDAIQAVDGGRELLIDGRSVRTERAECRRSVILSRIGGGGITTEEAGELLGRYGPIAQMQQTTHADGRMHGVPEGMWVKFAYFLDFKDCLKAFNTTTSLFKVFEAPNLEPRTRPAVTGGSPVIQQGLRTPRSTSDQKSIFVGNLPEDTNEAELLEIFSNYGQIKACNVIRKPITGGSGFNIFGFIEYADAAEAETASVAEIDIRSQRIRVEPKEYSARRHTRLQQPYGQPSSMERLPRGIAWGPSAGTYQQPGVQMPYGFQPIYVQAPPGGFPSYPPGYGWTATPPNSAQRQRGPLAEDYFTAGSPSPQFLQMHPAAFGMPQYRDLGLDDQQQAVRRYH